MSTERTLSLEEASSAARIQGAIDDMAAAGGRLVLPAMELELDRGLQLRSGVELVGQGEETVLRKGPGKVYPLSGYHNYGMCDVPLRSTAGLEVGMTVSVHDNRTRSSFYETFATITWIDNDWVGLDHGIEADYSGEEDACLTTAYPMIFGHGIEGAAVRDLRLEGNRSGNVRPMGGCRGAAVYFYKSRRLAITGIRERDYFGEGLGFQICRDVHVVDCQFDENTGNGLHPGAGSTNALLDNCAGEGNAGSGFFFCVRANHITIHNSVFKRNGNGISIGTRDCHNLIDGCTIEGNAGAGILMRVTPLPIEVHSCLIRDCAIKGNAMENGQGQVEVVSDAHDLIFINNRITGGAQKAPGVFIAPTARNVYMEGNHFEGCDPDVAAESGSLTGDEPRIECGYGTAQDTAFRHLE